MNYVNEETRFQLTSGFVGSNRVPVITVVREGVTNPPRVVVAHGFSHSKEVSLIDLYFLASMGFEAVAMDLVLHGERRNASQRSEVMASGFLQGMQRVVYETARDISSLLDKFGDAPTGFLGVSTGGFVGHVLAVTEKRIGAMALLASSPDWLTADPTVTPPKGSPLYQVLSSMSPVNKPDAYAPMPLLMLNGDEDTTVTSSGSILLHERLLPLYRRRGIEHKLGLEIFPGLGHASPIQMRRLAYDWLDKHLNARQ